MYAQKSHGVTLLIIYLSIFSPKNVIIDAFDYPFKFVEDPLAEGSPCTMENHIPGNCVELLKCPMRIEEVKQGKRFSNSAGRCSFKNFIEIVCCPTNITKVVVKPNGITNRPAQIACTDHRNTQYTEPIDSRDVKTNIFHGESALTGEFPYMAALGYNIKDDKNQTIIEYSCGGTLISNKHVLTAAHCVNNVQNLIPVEVKLGTVDLKSKAENIQRIPIGEIISHPKYKRSVYYYDISIVKLKKSISTSKKVQPICLQTKPIPNLQQLVNMSLIVTGWGATSSGINKGVEKLQKTPNLESIDKKECNDHYTHFTLRLPKGIDDSMICVLDRDLKRGADACQGDSGGPLILHYDSMNTVLGITSFGQGCGSSSPSIYTSVLYYLNWIENIVWPDLV